MAVRIPPCGCPVCGYADFVALDESNCTTFEVCPCCGSQSGYDYGTEADSEHLNRLRQHWLIEECGRWWSTTTLAYEHWDAQSQLKSAGLPLPTGIAVYYAENERAILCNSVAEMDAVLDRLHAEHLSSNQKSPLAIAIRLTGYEIDTGLGADMSFVCIQVAPCDGEYYLAVGDESATGESTLFYGAGQDTYCSPQNLVPLQAARGAVRYFAEHRQRSPKLRWQDWAQRDA